MKLRELITEAIDQTAADEVLRGLIAAGDTSAKYFQMTRYDTRYKSVDTAQRAAELMAKRAEVNKSTPATAKTAAPAPAKTPKVQPKAEPEPRDYSDRFYGNQYTGSLGGKDYQPGELSQLLGIKPGSRIGRAIGAAKSAAKPFDDLKRAFQLGANFASKKR